MNTLLDFCKQDPRFSEAHGSYPSSGFGKGFSKDGQEVVFHTQSKHLFLYFLGGNFTATLFPFGENGPSFSLGSSNGYPQNLSAVFSGGCSAKELLEWMISVSEFKSSV